MRFVVTVAVLLAVVATALVAVCQHSETRRLQHRVWQLERRRIRLERQAHQLESMVEAGRTPRRLLVEHDLNMRAAAPFREDAANETEPPATPRDDARGNEIALPAGFVTGGNFEGERR